VSVLIAALPAALASMVVLVIAGVGTTVWITQLAAMSSAVVVAVLLPTVRRWAKARPLQSLVDTLALLALIATILTSESSPKRWLAIGPMQLYVAPVVLPVLFAAMASWLTSARRSPFDVVLRTSLAAAWLTLQPDASQVLAYTLGMTVLLTREGQARVATWAALAVMAGLTVMAFLRPDPLQPVPYVEGVFALAMGRSWLVGLVVIATAVWFVAGLAIASRTRRWLAAAAVYYAVLFGCSIAGLTPAPVIGFGAGPILGVGVLAAAARRVE
jgi:cell division protein FtsW (lipid II flippase)